MFRSSSQAIPLAPLSLAPSLQDPRVEAEVQGAQVGTVIPLSSQLSPIVPRAVAVVEEGAWGPLLVVPSYQRRPREPVTGVPTFFRAVCVFGSRF